MGPVKIFLRHHPHCVLTSITWPSEPKNWSLTPKKIRPPPVENLGRWACFRRKWTTGRNCDTSLKRYLVDFSQLIWHQYTLDIIQKVQATPRYHPYTIQTPPHQPDTSSYCHFYALERALEESAISEYHDQMLCLPNRSFYSPRHIQTSRPHPDTTRHHPGTPRYHPGTFRYWCFYKLEGIVRKANIWVS